MKIKENISFRDYTTFHIGGPASFFVEVSSEGGLKEALEFADKKSLPICVLGGGSNVLISDKGFAGLVIRMVNKGISIVKESSEEVLIEVGAGEIWDDVVEFCVARGWWGVENMSYIPGLMGATAIQNIMAYGQQIGDVLEYVEVYDIKFSLIRKLTDKDCDFSYKSSIFNAGAKNRYIILQTVIRLKKNGEPIITYPDVIKYFVGRDLEKPSLNQIRRAIISIRVKKFGRLGQVRSAGSFFANPVLTNKEFLRLRQRIVSLTSEEVLKEFDELKGRFVVSEYGKLPIAFIIDKVLGLKGTRVGGAKVSERQAISIVNETGQASAADVLKLFKQVRQKIYAKTGLIVQNEPTLVGFSKEELDDYLEL